MCSLVTITFLSIITDLTRNNSIYITKLFKEDIVISYMNKEVQPHTNKEIQLILNLLIYILPVLLLGHYYYKGARLINTQTEILIVATGVTPMNLYMYLFAQIFLSIPLLVHIIVEFLVDDISKYRSYILMPFYLTGFVNSMVYFFQRRKTDASRRISVEQFEFSRTETETRGSVDNFLRENNTF